ncbi:deaminase domain-containing protein [Flavobacterium arcticum]|nr:deaminase domain-containing protein [Flavobacterium arcticum]
MSERSVILDIGIKKAFRKSNFQEIEFNLDGSVHSFKIINDPRRYVRSYRSTIENFYGFLEKTNFDTQKERFNKGEKVTTSEWRKGEFNNFDSLSPAESGDIVEGVYSIFTTNGKCKQKYVFTFSSNGNIPETFNTVSNIDPMSPNSYDCNDFGGNATHQGAFFNTYKDVLLSNDDGPNSTDIELIGKIAALLDETEGKTAQAFIDFQLQNIDNAQFQMIIIDGVYDRKAFEVYKKSLENWLDMLDKYKEKIKNLTDKEKLFIYIDVMYRHNMLHLLTVQQKIDILATMATGALITWYFASWTEGFQKREPIAIKVVESVTNEQAEEFLQKLVSEKVYTSTSIPILFPLPSVTITGENSLYKALFYRFDDFFGKDNFTAFAEKLNALVLAKNNIIQTAEGYIISTPEQLNTDNNFVKYNFIWNKKFNKDFKGEIEYDISYPSDNQITIKEKIVKGVTRRTVSYQGVTASKIEASSYYDESEVTLNHFDLVSITYLSNPSFLDLCEYADCSNVTFLASAAYIDYLLEKRDTKDIINTLSVSTQVLSLAFGVGELLAAIRTANTIRGIIGAWTILGDIYSLIISSPVFIEFLQEAYPNDYMEILETLNMIGLLNGLTNVGGNIFYSAYNIDKATKFIGYVDALNSDHGAIARMTAAEVKALHITRERLLAELYVLRKNSSVYETVENQILAYRNQRNLQLNNAVRGSTTEWEAAQQIIIQHRVAVSTPNGRNFAFLEGMVEGIDSSALIDPAVTNQNLTQNLWRSVSDGIAGMEAHVFTASVVGNYLRITDSEYRMLNKLALTLKPNAVLGYIYVDVVGNLKIVSENIFCVSCQNAIKQFNQMFPNVNITLIDGTRVGY